MAVAALVAYVVTQPVVSEDVAPLVVVTVSEPQFTVPSPCTVRSPCVAMAPVEAVVVAKPLTQRLPVVVMCVVEAVVSEE